MELYKLKIIESIIILLTFFGVRYSIGKAIKSITIKFPDQKPRVKIIKKLLNLLVFLICLGIMLFIWGVNQSELVFFISSLLTVLGIAFFAQWSIISNITSTVIIFFNHPAKIGDYITIYDKDFNIEGTISDIGVFFIIIKNAEGDKITIPSNVFIQKMVKRKGVD